MFGTIGRLVPFKAHDDLIEAYATVSAQMPDSRLIIIGRGPLQDELQQRVHKLGLQDRIRIHGFLDQAARYLRAFDVFVLPSRHEPFGLVLPEAMTAKVPVIATDSGGPREILPAQQQPVPTGDRKALAARMLALYETSSSARSTLAEEAYLRVQERFRIESYRAAYGALLGKKSP